MKTVASGNAPRKVSWLFNRRFASSRKLSVAVAIAFLASLPSARAAFSLFDDFQSYTVGDAPGQGGWTTGAGTASRLQIASAGSNKFLDLTGPDESDWFYKALGGSSIAGSSTAATFFFRVQGVTLGDMYMGLYNDTSQGNSSAAMGPGISDYVFRGNSTVDAENGLGTHVSIGQTGTWLKVWFVLHNSTGKYDVYADGGTGQTTIGTGFNYVGFGAWTAGTSLNDVVLGIVAQNGGAHTYFDDIYTDTTGQNLADPTAVVPEPTTFALLVGGLAMLIGIYRQQRK